MTRRKHIWAYNCIVGYIPVTILNVSIISPRIRLKYNVGSLHALRRSSYFRFLNWGKIFVAFFCTFSRASISPFLYFYILFSKAICNFTAVSGSVNLCTKLVNNLLIFPIFQKLSSRFLKQFTDSAETT